MAAATQCLDSGMPLRTFLTSSCLYLVCSESELSRWKQLLSLEPEPADAGADTLLEDTQLQAYLLRKVQWDSQSVSVMNALCPHWPPLLTRASVEQQARKTVDAGTHSSANLEDAYRAALGLDPSLPWDLFFEDPLSIPSALLNIMERQHSAAILLVQLEARIMAEHILNGSWREEAMSPTNSRLADSWLASKACHNGSLLQPLDIWDLPTVLMEETDRVGQHLAEAKPLHVALLLSLPWEPSPPG
jgi:hypothetical protein